MVATYNFGSVYTYGTISSIIVEIQPDSTNIKNDPRISSSEVKTRVLPSLVAILVRMAIIK